MKKLLISWFLIISLILCAASCEDSADQGGSQGAEQGSGSENSGDAPDGSGGETASPDEGGSDDGDEGAEKSVYELLTKLAKKEYSSIKLEIRTGEGSRELLASYTLTDDEVTYSVERFNLLPDLFSQGGSPDYKTTATGSCKIENGQITEFDGEEVALPEYEVLKGQFNFDKDNFKAPLDAEGIFQAEVISAAALLGEERKASDMKVTAEYSAEALKVITVSYKTEGSSVTARYEFTE